MAETQHRKLAAIMFTDIVGYTALMSRDERLALQVLDRHRAILKPLIQGANGEWLKEIGDGTLSAFASAVEAVQCALEIQRSLADDRDLTLRIGIHIGDVVFKDGDVFGDGVNVASRIEPLAEPGGICVTERVYDDIRNQSDLKAQLLGPKTLKGVARPILVYAIELRDKRGKVIATEDQATSHSGPSIAVLPFVDMSPEKDQDYFCDGLTEELIDTLAKIDSLRVVARTSAFAFKNMTQDIRLIGNQLSVDKLLEGSIRKSGNRLQAAAAVLRQAGFKIVPLPGSEPRMAESGRTKLARMEDPRGQPL
ncbi:MAG: adenylate/guanylate cyclase domain-containing protein [Candidatus Marinimicrobia bacterium]|nr:adenylate/guanylate cyclase domain-containing protein [Candidatus Neomarinimicrobiota bacterium]